MLIRDVLVFSSFYITSFVGQAMPEPRRPAKVLMAGWNSGAASSSCAAPQKGGGGRFVLPPQLTASGKASYHTLGSGSITPSKW